MSAEPVVPQQILSARVALRLHGGVMQDENDCACEHCVAIRELIDLVRARPALPAPEPPRLWHCEKCNHDFTGGPIHQCNDGFIANAVRVDAARTSATVASGATALAGAALPAEHAPSDPDLSAKLEELLEDLEQIQAGYEMASTAEARDLDAARTICRAAIHALFGSRPALAGSQCPRCKRICDCVFGESTP